jgi:hypothetical protein
MEFDMREIQKKSYSYEEILEVVIILKQGESSETITGKELLEAIEYNRRLC